MALSKVSDWPKPFATLSSRRSSLASPPPAASSKKRFDFMSTFMIAPSWTGSFVWLIAMRHSKLMSTKSEERLRWACPRAWNCT
jgi:hypothetical protein